MKPALTKEEKQQRYKDRQREQSKADLEAKRRRAARAEKGLMHKAATMAIKNLAVQEQHGAMLDAMEQSPAIIKGPESKQLE